MAAIFKTPSGCLTSSWNKAADDDKFQFRSGSKNTVMELVRSGGIAALVDDDFSDDPVAEGRAAEAGWDAAGVCFTHNVPGAYEQGRSATTGYHTNEFLEYLVGEHSNISAKANLKKITGYSEIGVACRVDKANETGYAGGLDYYPSGGWGNLAIWKIGAGSNTVLVEGESASNKDWNIWFLVVGNILKLKYWEVGTDEPFTGGPDCDGFQLKVEDNSYATGHVGLQTNTYSGSYYARCYNLLIEDGNYPTDSPLRFCEWRSGQAGTNWADDFTFKHNVNLGDSGAVKVRLGYSDTQPSTLSEADCDALLGALKTPDANGKVTGIAGKGDWRVAAFQFDSDGIQQTSLGIYDEAQEATLTSKMMRVGAEVEGLVEQGSDTLNDANISDTITPVTRPCVGKVSFDISNLLNAGDDFDLKISIGIAGSEVLVNFYNVTSDGTSFFIDTGDGIISTFKNKKIQAVSILVETGAVLKIDYAKNSANSRDVDYSVLFGI